MFIILMTDVYITLPDDLINKINYYYNNNIGSLIHIYEHGICITQNINDNTNISLYIKKDAIPIYNISKEIAFYNTKNFESLKEIKIISNQNLNYIVINDEPKKINFINSCNFCKNIQEIQFIETKIPKEILNDIDFNWLESRISLFEGDFKILLSDQINGIVIKIDESIMNVYINSIIN